jgi:integrase
MGRKGKSGLPYLHPRSDTGDYVYLKAVPVRFRPYLIGQVKLKWEDEERSYAIKGQGTIKIGLGTDDATLACTRALEIHRQVEPLFAALKRKTPAKAAAPSPKLVPQLPPEVIRRIGERIYAELLAADDEAALNPERDIYGLAEVAKQEGETIDPRDPTYGGRIDEAYETLLEAARRDLAATDITPVEETITLEFEDGPFVAQSAVDRELERLGLAILPGHPDRKALALNILRARVRAYADLVARRQGAPILTPSQPELVPQNPAVDGPNLAQLAERFLREVDLPPKTKQLYRRYLLMFAEFMGNRPAKLVTSQDVIAFRNLLLRLPTIVPKAMAGASPQTLAEWADQTPGKPRLSPQTVKNRGLGAVSSMFAWAVDGMILEVNPRLGVRVRNAEGTKLKRLSYTMDQLARIFAMPIYCDPDIRPKGGGGEAAVWLPMLALFTGARLEELAQLRVVDVQRLEGVDVLDLMTIDDDPIASTKRKTKSSRRLVPIHQKLIQLGFLTYCAAMKRNGETRLFPAVTSASSENSAGFSKWWGRYSRAYGEISGSEFVFHSFRHLFTDKLLEVTEDERLRLRITGHANTSVNSKYGRGHDIGKVNAIVQRVEFNGLDFSMVRLPTYV